MAVLSKYVNLGVGVLAALGYLLCVSIATWDRPEAMVPFVLVFCVMGLLALLNVIILRGRWLGVFDVLLLLVATYLAWRAWHSPVAMYAQTDLVLVCSVVLIWFGVSVIQIPLGAMRSVWIWMMLILLIINTYGSWYQVYVDPSWAFLVQRSSGMIVPTGVFTHYNYFGNFAIVAALSCLGALLGEGFKLSVRVVSLVVIVGNFVLLGMCESRGAFISAAAGMLAFLLMYVGHLVGRKWSTQKWWFGLTGVLITSIVVSLVYAQFVRLGGSRGWSTRVGGVDDSGRKDFSSLAVDQFFEAPFMGSGAHSVEWRGVSLLTERGEAAAGILNYAHNEYLQLLCDYGAIGLFLVFGLMLFFCGKLLMSILKGGDPVWIMATLAALVAYCVHCLFSFVVHIPANLITVVSLCALAWSGVRSRKPGKIGAVLAVIVVPLLFIASGYVGKFALRELPAWQIYPKINETIEVSEYEPELREQAVALAEVVEDAPNFRRYERLGRVYWKLYEMSSNVNDRIKSEEYYLKAVQLYPMSPSLRMNEARVLAFRGDNAGAEDAYEFVLKHGLSQRRWLRPYWQYGYYCNKRGNDLWLERESSQALAYFLKARDLLAQARVPSEARAQLREMRKDLNARIKLLESVGIKPAF